mmetsp:Transcript_14706/g.49459  ORF Transcript_14706/g.49459 Transcript_14706/m.49459 type:complete len:222 (+) Transcript_14706:165-830(+)
MEHCARLDLKRSPAARDRHGQRCRLALTFSPEERLRSRRQLFQCGASHQLDSGLVAGKLQPLGTWLCFRPELTHGAGLPLQRVRVRTGTTHSPTGAQKPLDHLPRAPPTPRRRWSNRPPTTDAPLLVGKGNHSLGPLLVQRQKTLPMNPSSEGHSEAEWYCGDAAERGVVRANSLPDPECAPDSAPPPTTETVGDVAWRSSGSRASFDAVPEKESPNVVSI